MGFLDIIFLVGQQFNFIIEGIGLMGIAVLVFPSQGRYSGQFNYLHFIERK